MMVLLDTHLLLWAASAPQRIPAAVRSILKARDTSPLFSAASIWEIVIKSALGRPYFHVDPRLLRKGLLLHG